MCRWMVCLRSLLWWKLGLFSPAFQCWAQAELLFSNILYENLQYVDLQKGFRISTIGYWAILSFAARQKYHEVYANGHPQCYHSRGGSAQLCIQSCKGIQPNQSKEKDPIAGTVESSGKQPHCWANWIWIIEINVLCTFLVTNFISNFKYHI